MGEGSCAQPEQSLGNRIRISQDVAGENTQKLDPLCSKPVRSLLVALRPITGLVRDHFKLTPKGIIEDLELRRPIYRKTAAFGHFGRTEDGFTWEKTDRAEALRSAAGL